MQFRIQLSQIHSLLVLIFRYLDSDDTFKNETGVPIDRNGTIGVEGSYGYTAPNGKRYVTYYQADKDGYTQTRRQAWKIR